MFTVTIPRQILSAVSRFKAKNDIRHYLNGVKVEAYANVAYVVATDGCALCAGKVERAEHWEMQGQGETIIPGELVEKIKAKGNNGLPLVLSVSDSGEITLTDCGTKTTAQAIDGSFPDWRRVIPRNPSGEAANFNPEYLMLCYKASQDLGKKLGYFDFAQNGQSAALANLRDDVLAVVMPMRGEPATLPEWVDVNPEGFGRESDLDKAWDEAIAQYADELAIAA